MAVRALSVVAALGLLGSTAWAQPNVVDKRKKDPNVVDKRKRDPNVVDKRKRDPNVVDKRKRRPDRDKDYGKRDRRPDRDRDRDKDYGKRDHRPDNVVDKRDRPDHDKDRDGDKHYDKRDRRPDRDKDRDKDYGKRDRRPDNVVDRRDRRADWRDARRRYHRNRPLVSRYFPRKGKVGTKVNILGREFAPDVLVTIGGKPVKATRVKPRRIVLRVPRGSKGGLIRLSSRGRTIPVGVFEVVDGYDYAAERRRQEAERRSAAEAAWKARQAKIARDRAARQRAYEARQRELAESRAERRRERIARIRARWKRAFLADAETRVELALHAERIARLERMLRLAELNLDGKLAVRVEIATRRENDRHEQRMETLMASFAAGGAR